MNIQFKTEYQAALANTEVSAEEYHKLKEENAALRARITALETVEWILDVESDDYYCPWCVQLKELGHTPDCPRGGSK